MRGSSCISSLRLPPSRRLVSEPVAIHALTIGAIGGLTLGMMTRTARGHTGRSLKADRFEVAAFVLVQLAALARIVGALATPWWYVESVAAGEPAVVGRVRDLRGSLLADPHALAARRQAGLKKGPPVGSPFRCCLPVLLANPMSAAGGGMRRSNAVAGELRHQDPADIAVIGPEPGRCRGEVVGIGEVEIGPA